MFESNVSVDHFVPSQHTTCSSSSAALAFQKDKEQISFINYHYFFSISNKDSIPRFQHNYTVSIRCLTTLTTLIHLSYYNTITEDNPVARFFPCKHHQEAREWKRFSSLRQFHSLNSTIAEKRGEGARNYLNATPYTRTWSQRLAVCWQISPTLSSGSLRLPLLLRGHTVSTFSLHPTFR